MLLGCLIPVSSEVHKENEKRTKCILRATRAEGRLCKRSTREPFENRIRSLATKRTPFYRGGKVLVIARRRRLPHGLVWHVRVDHSGLHLTFQSMKAFRKLFDITIINSSANDVSTSWPAESYPLLGPRFIGTRLNWQVTPRRRQLEQASTPDSELASQRTWKTRKLETGAVSRLVDRRRVPFYACIHRMHERFWTVSAAHFGHHSSDHGWDRRRPAGSG